MWLPRLPDNGAPLSAGLLQSLRQDIASGALPPGARLPPHRDLAHRLGIGIGTVTGVYAEATQLGLIEARVGRGSFVRAASAEAETGHGTALLSYNIPPLEPAGRRFAATLARLRARPDLLDHLSYAPAIGFPAHRRSAAAWLQRSAGLEQADPGRLVITAGAQQAMALALGAICRPGDVILTEAASFFGIKSLAQHAGYRLQGLAMDAEGLLPEALERAAAAGARVLYTMPTLQNPTGRIMGAQRRRDIAQVAKAHRLWILEDDVYGAFAAGNAPPPLRSFLPEQIFYISSVSKSLAPGLRTGYLLAPSAAMVEKITGAVRAQSYAPAMIGSMIASQWIDDGSADQIVAEMAVELRVRHALAARMLQREDTSYAPPQDDRCPHLWLPMAALQAERLAARCLRGGVELTPPAAPIVAEELIAGVRLCLGAIPARARYEAALAVVAAALVPEQGERAMAVI